MYVLNYNTYMFNLKEYTELLKNQEATGSDPQKSKLSPNQKQLKLTRFVV